MFEPSSLYIFILISYEGIPFTISSRTADTGVTCCNHDVSLETGEFIFIVIVSDVPWEQADSNPERFGQGAESSHFRFEPQWVSIHINHHSMWQKEKNNESVPFDAKKTTQTFRRQVLSVNTIISVKHHYFIVNFNIGMKICLVLSWENFFALQNNDSSELLVHETHRAYLPGS